MITTLNELKKFLTIGSTLNLVAAPYLKPGESKVRRVQVVKKTEIGFIDPAKPEDVFWFGFKTADSYAFDEKGFNCVVKGNPVLRYEYV